MESDSIEEYKDTINQEDNVQPSLTVIVEEQEEEPHWTTSPAFSNSWSQVSSNRNQFSFSSSSEEGTDSYQSEISFTTESSEETSYHTTSEEASTMSDPGKEETAAATVTILGRVVKLSAEPNEETNEARPMYPHSVRKSMDTKAFAAFTAEATKSILSPPLDFMQKLSDSDKLDDVYNLTQHISSIQYHCIKYDMHDVFQVLDVDPKKPLTLLSSKQVDLFTNSSTLSNEQVGLSIQWIRKWMDHTAEPHWEQNLVLSLEFLEKNCTPELWRKCMETLKMFPALQQGGPLMFRIILDKLQSDTEQAVRHLSDTIKNLKLTDCAGEDVCRVASLIRSAHQRLSNVRRVPEDFNKWVLEIMQTSSVAEFNKIFDFIELSLVATSTQASQREYPSFENILELGERHYLEMNAQDKWSGVNRNQHGVFQANKSLLPPVNQGYIADAAPRNPSRQPTCWNCGEVGHTLDQCTKPRNESEIAARRDVQRATRRVNRLARKSNKANAGATVPSSGASVTSSVTGPTTTQPPNKFAPPTPEENNKQVIDGKPMYYNHRLKRWLVDRFAGSPAPVAALATGTVASPGTTSSSNDPAAALHQCIDSVNRAFTQLHKQMSDQA